MAQERRSSDKPKRARTECLARPVNWCSRDYTNNEYIQETIDSMPIQLCSP